MKVGNPGYKGEFEENTGENQRFLQVGRRFRIVVCLLKYKAAERRRCRGVGLYSCS